MKRIDETGFGDLKLLQESEGFCYGIDAVLLAGFAAERLQGRNRPKRLCDLGTGTGIVPLILAHKTSINDIWGLEVQPNSFALAQETRALNGLEERLNFLQGNVKALGEDCCKEERKNSILEALGGSESFGAITMNPPYTADSHGIPAGNLAKNIARHEVCGSLEDFLQGARILLKDRGHLFMVHRPGRLAEICETACRLHLEPREVVFVSGKEKEAPNILLMHCVKNGGRGVNVLPSFYVREQDGSYSPEVLRIYERESTLR